MIILLLFVGIPAIIGVLFAFCSDDFLDCLLICSILHDVERLSGNRGMVGVQEAIQEGFFPEDVPEDQEFYATNYLMNAVSHKARVKVYSEK